jgi:DNA repair protein RadD
MSIEFRQYQIDAIESIWDYFVNNKSGNPLVSAFTGTGKSIIIAGFIKSVLEKFPDQKIMVLTHVKELIDQNHKELLLIWDFAPAGIYSSGLKRRDKHSQVIFAGIASVKGKAEEFGKVDLIIIDECHLVSPSSDTMYREFIKKMTVLNPSLRLIGFTATPWRLGTGRLTDPFIKGKEVIKPLFTDICFDNTQKEEFNKLVSDGYLCSLISKSTKYQLDVSDVGKRGGEFIQNELNAAVDKYEITERALEEAVELGEDRRHWLIFSISIEHAEHISDMLNNRFGIKTAVIHSQMDNKSRDKSVNGFKTGSYRALVNVGCLTTGFNFPGIDIIVMLRPTSSSSLFVQMCGRGCRTAEGKENCLVLDFSGNTKRLGPINDPIIPRAKGQSDGGGEAPIKECPECHCLVHISAVICSGLTDEGLICGHKFSMKTKLTESAYSGDIILQEQLPIIEEFPVDIVTYNKHSKKGSVPSLCVGYLCGIKSFKSWLCVEHSGYPRIKAERWWKSLSGRALPKTVDEVLKEVKDVRKPSHIRVWSNKKYPEVVDLVFAN